MVFEREVPHPPEKVWRALTQSPLALVRMEQSGFRPEDEAGYQSASCGWQRFIGGLQRVVAGLD